jgi:predicted MFS family arabinose efflux permease
VVWAATIGSVAGPNLAHPAERLGAGLGLAPEAGPFALAAVAFLAALAIVLAGLRPDPLVLARRVRGDRSEHAPAGLRQAWAVLRTTPAVRRGLTAIAVSHTAMVSIMSMTPVHLDHGGASISVIGMVISLHIAGMYMLSPLVGWLADRIGGIRVLVLGMAQLLVAAVLAGTAGPHGVGQVTAGLVVLGTGWSCGLVAGSAMLTEATPVERRPAVQGLSDLLMNVCGASGTLVAGAVVGAVSYGALGAAVGVLVTATGAWLLAHGLSARRTHFTDSVK